MSAILRNNAARSTFSAIGEATLRSGGGDGRHIPATRRKKVGKKVRYSADPAGELMPAAEFLGHDPDFAAILEDFRDSPFDPSRRSVLGRLMGVFAMDYQGARYQERAFLRRLLGARNAREGYAANRALHLCGASPAIRRTLALGVAEARWPKGKVVGFVGAVQARVAATTFALLGPNSRETLWNLLTLAGRGKDGPIAKGADPVIERALILKATGARRHRLGPWSADGVGALAEITELAECMRGCWRTTLAARTTLIAGDEHRVAKQVAASDGAERAALIARGEVDPIFAWKTHAAGVEPAPKDAATGEDIYKALPDLDRSPLLFRPRLHQALAEARAAPEDRLELAQIEAVADYLAGRELSESRDAQATSGIEVLRDRGFDVSNIDAIETIRADARGIYKFDAAHGLGLLLSRYTGAMYVRRVFSDQLTAGTDPVQQISAALAKGFAVPLTVKEPRSPLIRAWAVLSQRQEAEEDLMTLSRPGAGAECELRAKQLVATVLPKDFGRKARADIYLAPAALDLLAPPFGIAFPELGITDAL